MRSWPRETWKAPLSKLREARQSPNTALTSSFVNLPLWSSSKRVKRTAATWSLSSWCDTQEATFLNSSTSTPMFSQSRRKSARSSSTPPASTWNRFPKEGSETPRPLEGQIFSTLFSIAACFFGGILEFLKRKWQRSRSLIRPEASLDFNKYLISLNTYVDLRVIFRLTCHIWTYWSYLDLVVILN